VAAKERKMSSIQYCTRVLALAALLVVAGCGGGSSDNSNPPGANVGAPATPVTQATFAIGGAVSGLAGSGLALQNNGGDDLAVAADGAFVFATRLVAGTAYAVSVKTQPINPAQTCTVTRGSGNVAAADVTDVAVTCATNTGGGGGGAPAPSYAGTFGFDGSYDQGRANYVGEAQLRYDFEGDFQNERRYTLAAATAVFSKWEHDNTTELCRITANGPTPMAANGTLTFNPTNQSYALTGGLLVFAATSTCTNKNNGSVSVTPTLMNVLVASAELPADPGYLPVAGDGSVLVGSRTYVGALNVLTQRNEWRLERR
jgi:hypothetical protein